MPLKVNDIVSSIIGKQYRESSLSKYKLFLQMYHHYNEGFIYDKKTRLVLYGPGFQLSYEEACNLSTAIATKAISVGYYYKIRS